MPLSSDLFLVPGLESPTYDLQNFQVGRIPTTSGQAKIFRQLGDQMCSTQIMSYKDDEERIHVPNDAICIHVEIDLYFLTCIGLTMGRLCFCSKLGIVGGSCLGGLQLSCSINQI